MHITQVTTDGIRYKRKMAAIEPLQDIVPNEGAGWYTISSSPKGTNIKLVAFHRDAKPNGECCLPANQFYTEFDGQDWKLG